MTIGEGYITVKTISDRWASERKEERDGYVHVPDERKTVHRLIKNLQARGYVSSRKKEDYPYDTEEYFLDENQRFMFKLTGQEVKDEKVLESPNTQTN